MALVAFTKIHWKRIGISTDQTIGRIAAMLFDTKNLTCTAIEIRILPMWRRILVSCDNFSFSSRSRELHLKKCFQRVDGVDSVNLMSTSVYTQESVYLGKVRDFLFDSTTFTIIQLEVSRRFLLWKTSEHLIHRGEIISVEKDKIIVKDEVILEEAGGGMILPRADVQIIRNAAVKSSGLHKS